MFSQYELTDDTYPNHGELDRREADEIGSRNPERCWICTDRDVWHLNPYFEGEIERHPEAYEDDEPDNEPDNPAPERALEEWEEEDIREAEAVMKEGLILQGKAFAKERYNDGLDFFVECYTDGEWEEYIDDHQFKHLGELRAHMLFLAACRKERQEAIEAECY